MCEHAPAIVCKLLDFLACKGHRDAMTGRLLGLQVYG